MASGRCFNYHEIQDGGTDLKINIAIVSKGPTENIRQTAVIKNNIKLLLIIQQ